MAEEKSTTVYRDMLDIIFADRNKAYGAYKLRREYPKYLTRAFLLAIGLVVVVFAAPIIMQAVGDMLPKEKPVDVIAELGPPPDIDPNNPPPPPPPPPPPLRCRLRLRFLWVGLIYFLFQNDTRLRMHASRARKGGLAASRLLFCSHSERVHALPVGYRKASATSATLERVHASSPPVLNATGCSRHFSGKPPNVVPGTKKLGQKAFPTRL